MNDFKESVQFVHALVIARERGSEVEAKSVHVHFEDPIAQAVHHQLQRARMQQVKRVARAGEIQIETRIVRLQPVVSEIVDPAKAKRRAEMISFRRMIVNHIENHFDTRRVEIAHHRFELEDLFAQLSAAGVLRVRREKSDRVVAPIVSETPIDQCLVINMRMHRQ